MAPKTSSSSSSSSKSKKSSSSSFYSQVYQHFSSKWQHWNDLLSRALHYHSQPTVETFPELTHIMIWFRAIIAVCYGMWLGWDATRGAAGILLGANVITFLPLLYCTTYLRADAESYGLKLFLGGVVNAVALMVLVWIYCFTARHAVQENMLRQLVNSTMIMVIQEKQAQLSQQPDYFATTSSATTTGAEPTSYNNMDSSSSSTTFPLNIPAEVDSQETEF
jgi:hypothetical protein